MRDEGRADMLLPLPETRFFSLDLLGEALPELFLLLLELGVVQLLDLRLAELPGLHLLLAVVFVVQVLRRGDEVKHVGTNKQRAQLLEIAVVLIFD